MAHVAHPAHVVVSAYRLPAEHEAQPYCQQAPKNASHDDKGGLFAPLAAADIVIPEHTPAYRHAVVSRKCRHGKARARARARSKGQGQGKARQGKARASSTYPASLAGSDGCPVDQSAESPSTACRSRSPE